MHTYLREATALDIATIVELIRPDVEEIEPSQMGLVAARIERDLTSAGSCTYWVADVEGESVGFAKVSATGGLTDALISLDWIVAPNEDIAVRLAAISLGDDLEVDAWALTKTQVTLLERIGFEKSGKEGQAPMSSLVAGPAVHMVR